MLVLAAFLALMGTLEWFIFFRDVNHFFQADTIFWLYHRATSWLVFFKGFLSLDAGGWYRPLGNRVIPFLFFPLFGLHPAGYRVVIFILFFLNTAAVLVLLMMLTRSRIAACAGAFFFGTHTINAFTTYDAAFAPELLFGFFYVCAVIAFLRYRETARAAFLAGSVVCFILSLFSKEAAVTLPATLLAVGLLSSTGTIRKRIWVTATAVRWHFIVLFVYLIFVAGYLRVAGITAASLLNSPAEINATSYSLVPDRALFVNVDYALTWAFNIPRGWISQSRDFPEWCLTFLKAFRFGIAGMTLILLFKRRAWLLLGVAWFLIAVSPALPWRNHFLPYYLFVPIIGFSLVIGAAADWLNECFKSLKMTTARAALLLPLLVLGVVSEIGIHNDIRNNTLLGRSSRLAQKTLTDLNTLFPELQAGTTIYVINDAEPNLAWDHSLGDLFKLHYKQDAMTVLYSSKGATIPPDSGSLIVVKYENEHLRDVTGLFQSSPLEFAQYLSKGPANSLQQ